MKPAEPTPRTSIWITPREAAEYLDVGVDIIYDGCGAGGLKARASGHARFVCVGNGWTPGRRPTRASRSEVRPCRSGGVADSKPVQEAQRQVPQPRAAQM